MPRSGRNDHGTTSDRICARLAGRGILIRFDAGRAVIRWVAVIFAGLFVFYVLFPGLARLGVGRLPGDVRFRLAGLEMCLPLGSTVLWSAVAFLIAELVKHFWYPG